jgi:dihydroflavonol-4-reductase
LPFAAAAEAVARLTGGEPFATVDGLRMAKKKMFFTSARATAELEYAARPARQALADAVAWYTTNGYVR